jgi:glycosyltransferase involved in cell wall biosynthesis
MLRVLTLSTLFPDASRPTLGIFVERQTLGLAARPGVEVEVAAGIGLPPWPLSLHPHYRARDALPLREERNGLIVHRPRFRTLPGLWTAGAGRALARAVLPLLGATSGRKPFDVIDSEFFWPDGVAAMHLAAALDLPFSIKARGSDIHWWGQRREIAQRMVEAARRADGLLAVSAALKRSMVALGMPGEKVRVHHTGVDLEHFVPVDRAAAKAALGIEGPLIVCAGALIPLKGQRLALAALAALPGATLLFVGDGPDREMLEREGRRHGERVRFLGARPHEEMPAVLAAADVMVLPSEREGLANVWIEALACGTPVVTCDVGGAREAIDRPEAGRLVPRESAAIAAAVREILADPPDQAAVREAAERFSWDRNRAELFNHLSGLAERH